MEIYAQCFNVRVQGYMFGFMLILFRGTTSRYILNVVFHLTKKSYVYILNIKLYLNDRSPGKMAKNIKKGDF